MGTMQLVGDRNLQLKLEQLKQGMQNRILKAAVGSALKPIREAAKANAPHPDFVRLVGARVVKSKKSKGVVGKVFVGAHPTRKIKWKGEKSHSKSGDVNFAVVAAFYEFGTPHMPPTFWMRGAMRSNRDAAMRILTDRARERLRAEVDRARASGTEIWRPV